ncbi:GyrI-like domain-containing protein [Flavobacteriales bacterium]|nr:GyrI-like domain-containing protein [Flavobacteriales bacterium]MDB2653021.1 GyrI-like domain-containing protein [Flavobacteriales bacterium]MDG1396193.1 GyrI-like domain-containing protein [Flavobacteriales bacterium]
MKTTFKVLVLLTIVLIVPNLFLNNRIDIERTVEIESPINMVFMKVANVSEWGNWYPFYLKDVSVKFDPTESIYGAGANLEWNTEKNNSGVLKLNEVVLNKKVAFNLLYSGRVVNEVLGEFTFEQVNRKTRVTCNLNQSHPLLFRVFGFFGFKKIEQEFEIALQNLKKQVEESQNPFHILMYQKEAFSVYSKTLSCKTSTIGRNLERTYKELQKQMQEDGIAVFGKPICIYHNYSDTTVELEAALPIHQITKRSKYTKTINSATVLKATYVGPYDKSQATYDALDEFAIKNGLKIKDSHYQIFITDPGIVEDPSKWVTEIYYTLL